MQRISKLYPWLPKSSPPAAGAAAEMPDLRGPPFLGTLAYMLDSRSGKLLHEYVDLRHRRHGPVFRGQVGPTKAVFVSSVDAIKQVFKLEGPTPQHYVPEAWLLYNKVKNRQRGLLFMDGEEWLHHRRILNKVMLASESTTMMSEPCQRAAEHLVEKWKNYTNNDRIVPDLENQLYQWSIEVLLAAMVGSEPWDEYRRSILGELEPLSRSLGLMFEHSVDLAKLPAKLAMWARLPSWSGFVETADHALDTVSRFVDQMARLEGNQHGLLAKMIRLGVSDDELKRIVVDLILAAGDTTAYSMQWLLFLMGSSLEVQEKVHEGLKGLSEAEILNDPLLRGVIKESLRLYPIAPFLTRVLPQDTLLGGYPAYKGELVVISFYSCSRDEANFPRAHEFLPERWLRNEKGEFRAVTNPHATLPFAMGARSCIGKRLAEIQMSLTMAELSKSFKIECLNKNDISLKLRLISAPSEPLQLQLTPRTDV